jgi:hypothetical protein
VKRASDSSIAYNPLPDATSESEVQTLAAVYAFILECHAKRKATEGSGDDDGETEFRLHKEGRSPCDVDE